MAQSVDIPVLVPTDTNSTHQSSQNTDPAHYSTEHFQVEGQRLVALVLALGGLPCFLRIAVALVNSLYSVRRREGGRSERGRLVRSASVYDQPWSRVVAHSAPESAGIPSCQADRNYSGTTLIYRTLCVSQDLAVRLCPRTA